MWRTRRASPSRDVRAASAASPSSARRPSRSNGLTSTAPAPGPGSHDRPVSVWAVPSSRWHSSASRTTGGSTRSVTTTTSPPRPSCQRRSAAPACERPCGSSPSGESSRPIFLRPVTCSSLGGRACPWTSMSSRPRSIARTRRRGRLRSQRPDAVPRSSRPRCGRSADSRRAASWRWATPQAGRA